MLFSHFRLSYVPQALDSTTNDLQEVTSYLLTKSTLNSAFPNLATLYCIPATCTQCILPVTKATVEYSFSGMRKVETGLHIEDPVNMLSEDKLATILTHSKAQNLRNIMCK